MNEQQLFIFGLGYSAKAIAKIAMGKFDNIAGTSRQHDRTIAKAPSAISRLVFDGITLSNELEEQLAKTTHLLVSIAPGDEGDPVLNTCEEFLASHCTSLKWISYLSTVGVYGNHDGAWVDEDTPCKPVSKRSIWRLEAESNWQNLASTINVPLAIFRLSGIYGPGRNAFVNMENGTSRRMVKPGQVFNRIYVDDIASAVNLAIVQRIDGIYNITDDEPSAPQDVVTFAYHLAGRKPPPEIDFETADISPMARSFYGENKRVSNAKSKSELDMEIGRAHV